MSETKKSGLHYGWVICFVGFMIMWFVICPISNCWGLFVVPVCETFGISRTQFSLVSTCNALAGMVFSMFTGQLYGKFGIKRVMTVSSIILPIAYACYGLAPSIQVFYAIAFVCGFTSASISLIAISSLMANWFVEKRGTAIAIAATGSGIGGVIMNPIIGVLNTSMGWRKTYIILAVVMFITVVPCVVFLVKDKPADKGLEPYGGLPQTDGASPVTSGLTLAEAVKKPYFYMTAVVFLIVGASCTGVMGNTAAYVTDLGYEYSFASVVASIVTGSLAIGKLAMGVIFDKLGAQKAATISLAGFVFSFTMYTFAHSKLILLAGVGIIGFGLSFASVAYSIVVQDLFGRKDYSNIYGKFTVLSSRGAAAINPLMATIYDKTGSFVPGWTALIVTSVICIVMVNMAFTLKKKEM